MAVYMELNSFVSKFCQLWCDGFQADLHLRCVNGQSYLNFNVGLGYAFQATNSEDFYSPSNSRIRRSAKRARMRRHDGINKTAEETQNDDVENVVVQDSSPSEDLVVAANIDDVEEKTCDSSIQEETLSGEDIGNPLQQDIETQNVVDTSEVIGASMQIASVETEEDEVEKVCIEESAIHVDDTVEVSKVESRNENSVCAGPPKLIEIHATAIFDKSPTHYLSQEEYESLGRFVTNLEHLQRNIQNVVVDSYSTRNNDDGTFMHTANVRIHVKSKHLWESGRSYLWKHLGHDTWERGNGTCITLKRIHQKT